MSLITLGVIAVVFAHWGLTTKQALDQGIFNFDSLWYHMPFAVDMVQSHSVTGTPLHRHGLHQLVLPAELRAAARGRDPAHPPRHALALHQLRLAGGRLPRGLVHRAALWPRPPHRASRRRSSSSAIRWSCASLGRPRTTWPPRLCCSPRSRSWSTPGPSSAPLRPCRGRGGAPCRSAGHWPLAGLAVGLAVGTRDTALAMAAALTVAVVVLAPPGRRRAAAGWWLVPALLGGGFWYLRNLIVAGNPLPEVAHLGPISLPHPEQLQTARPGFSISHYATDTAIWREYFAPGLHQAFGVLWPLVVGGAILAAVLALLRGRDRAVRWIGGVALFGMLAYLFTPLSAAGAQGAPVAFAINVRFVIPALLVGSCWLPLARCHRGRAPPVGADRRPAPRPPRHRSLRRRPPRSLTGLCLAARGAGRGGAGGSASGPAPGRRARRRSPPALPASRSPWWRSATRCSATTCATASATLRLPGMHLDAAYRWARDTSGTRIGLAGTTAGFLQYGFYGTDLSNRVIYLGDKGPHGAFNPIPTCRDSAPRSTPPASTTSSPPRSSTSSTPATRSPPPRRAGCGVRPPSSPILRSGPVTVWRVRGALDPSGCGPANAPLRRIPNAPGLRGPRLGPWVPWPA